MTAKRHWPFIALTALAAGATRADEADVAIAAFSIVLAIGVSSVALLR